MKGFLKYECKLYLKQPSSPSLSLYRTSNHMVIGISQWPTIPIHGDNKMWHYFCFDIIETKTHHVLEFLLYNSFRHAFIGEIQAQDVLHSISLGN